MDFKTAVCQHKAVLMEGALGERLKREHHLHPDPHVALARHVCDPQGKKALKKLWLEYASIAAKYELPFLATTPTRRANQLRVEQAGLNGDLISDNVAFLRGVQKECGAEFYVGGMVGCKGDAYTGEGALAESDANAFHKWQIDLLGEAKVDFLFAALIPTLPEAAGIAMAMAATDLPYIISFTIQGNGRLIDGTAIADAISYIDQTVSNPPTCYMTNCVHPRIVYAALSQPFNDMPFVRQRFWGIQANTSPLSYAELDNAADLLTTEPEALADEMLSLRHTFGLRIFGGCCGTDGRHMEQIAQRLA